jgi:hypothetical protein
LFIEQGYFFLKSLLRWVANLLGLHRQVRLVTLFFPRRSWYRVALAACRLHGALNGLMGGNRVLTEAVMLDHWLVELTRIGPFPIPWTISGTELIEAADPTIGTLYCWIHEPLAEFPLRPYLERGYPEPMVVADPGRILDGGQLMAAGMERRLIAITADRYALARARRSLQDGIPVVCLADARMGGPLYPLILQLAGRVGARVLFQWARRRPDGTIEVTFVNAPRSYCETKEDVQENLAFLREAQRRMLGELGLQSQLFKAGAENDVFAEGG